MLAMRAKDLVARDELPHRTLVATVMSNIGLETALSEKSIALVRTPVGDRYVLEEMQRGGFRWVASSRVISSILRPIRRATGSRPLSRS